MFKKIYFLVLALIFVQNLNAQNSYNSLKTEIDRGYDIFISEKDAEALNKTDTEGTTLLLHALHLGKTKYIDKLIESGKTALIYAAIAGNLEVLKNLIYKGADVSITDNVEHEIIYREENFIDRIGEFFTTKVLKKDKKERPEYTNWTAREYASDIYIDAANKYFISDLKNEIASAKTKMKLYKDIIKELDKAQKALKKNM
jgi:hypothetical protein